jgi:hypothetical protein
VTGTGRTCRSLLEKEAEAVCACCEMYRLSPVTERRCRAFQSSRMGRYVSGRKMNATRKAEDEIVSVM